MSNIAHISSLKHVADGCLPPVSPSSAFVASTGSKVVVYTGTSIIVSNIVVTGSAAAIELHVTNQIDVSKSQGKNGDIRQLFFATGATSGEELLLAVARSRVLVFKFIDQFPRLVGNIEYPVSSPDSVARGFSTSTGTVVVLHGKNVYTIDVENAPCSITKQCELEFHPSLSFWNDALQQIVVANQDSNRCCCLDVGSVEDGGLAIKVSSPFCFNPNSSQVETRRILGSRTSAKQERARWLGFDRVENDVQSWIYVLESWSKSLTSHILNTKPNLRSVGFRNALNLKSKDATELEPLIDLGNSGLQTTSNVLGSLLNIGESTASEGTPSSLIREAKLPSPLIREVNTLAEQPKQVSVQPGARILIMKRCSSGDRKSVMSNTLQLPDTWLHVDIVSRCVCHAIALLGTRHSHTFLVVSLPTDTNQESLEVLSEVTLPLENARLVGATACCAPNEIGAPCRFAIAVSAPLTQHKAGNGSNDKGATSPAFFFGGPQERSLHIGVVRVVQPSREVQLHGEDRVDIHAALDRLTQLVCTRFDRLEESVNMQNRRIEKIESLFNINR